MMRPSILLALAIILAAGRAHADAVVLKRTLGAAAVEAENTLSNPSLELVEQGAAAGAHAWEAGYEIDDQVSRTGARSARITSDDPEVQYGLFFEVELAQERPAPVVAGVWSRSEGVSGGPGSGYSLWVDIEFTDGTHLWGQNAPFECGDHDWQQRTLPVAASKPIRWIRVFGLFRNKTGTVWFDDFSLSELELEEGASSFNGVPVALERPALEPGEVLELPVADGAALRMDAETGALLGDDGAVSGIFWRDVAAGSDFRQPRGRVEHDGRDAVLHARDEELSLELHARFSPRPDCVEVAVTVTDLTGEDRAVSVYLDVPVDAVGGRWHDDARVSRPIEEGLSYENVVRSGAGPRGTASRYPLGCVTAADSGLALAIPMDRPRLAEFAYDGDSRELYAAIHLGLCAETAQFPSMADFTLAVYPVDARWGFRDALRRYYALYPHCFTKRNEREGIWMPFTDVSTVEGWEDFGFAFHEGNNNVAFDDEADIYSFVYCEPVGYWLRMPPEMPRTDEEAVGLLERNADTGDAMAQATLASAVHDAGGNIVLDCINAPWCDGARFILNPSPHLLAEQPDAQTRARVVGSAVWRAFDQAAASAHWQAYGDGFSVAAEAGRRGGQAIRCSADEPGRNHGARQSVAVQQDAATNLLVGGWSRAERLDGDPGADWCLYVDITYADGDHLWGQKAVFDAGREGWQHAETVIEVQKPVRAAAVYAMLRGDATGSVLFDDLFFGEVGGETNLLRDAGFEPGDPGELDGIYIDSSEMGASTPNYRREQWRDARTPLTFARDAGVCQLTVFNTTEFARGLAEPLHERGLMLMANSTPNRFPWLAAWCDVMGTETNWSPGEEYRPMTDEQLSYRRAICYQRPYLLLLNTVYDDFKPEWVELYFKRAVAYGVFPGFFSHNAATDRYWDRPKLYNRDRPLFRKYIPICAALSRAGWEPVTHASVSPAHVYVERFGPGPDGSVYFTLFNDGAEASVAQLSVDCTALGIAPELREVLPDGPEPRMGRAGHYSVALGAEDLAVLEATRAR